LILHQYVRLTGYNRKPAVRVLAKPAAGKTVIDGKTVVCKAEKKRGLKTGRANRSTPGKPLPVSKPSGMYLAELIRQNIDFLAASRGPDLRLAPDIRARPPAVSGRRTGRLLKPAGDALPLRRHIRNHKRRRRPPQKKSPSGPGTPARSVPPPGFAGPTRFITAATPVRGNLRPFGPASPSPAPVATAHGIFPDRGRAGRARRPTGIAEPCRIAVYP
jgi:hypothetical protein